ncbi:MAG: acyltransferase [Anaerolineae bacterium]
MKNEQETSPQPIPESLLSQEAFQQARQMPWKVRLELLRWLQWLPNLMALYFSGAEVGVGWRFYGMPIWQVHRDSSVEIGERLNLRASVASNPLGVDRPVIISTRRVGAQMTIGDDFGMTGGSIVCDQSITIGNRVTVGANSLIVDTDFHPLEPDKRLAQPLAGNAEPVTIGDDVFIGMRCMILKGAQIGQGSVIGAGSVVTGHIPDGVIAVGNPARVLRQL